ncbi:BRCA1 C Terminus domain-containing protein [Histoplasma capsulatum]|uniref:BRCA1 C Terminus domain-containing protein n=1 Tax=Ajellomyces capsulatus TaxID=5037 RepID=A0A8A1MH56_AJECA|nr:predicted protein [Histoplasma mississippiense (nom. inval.)]EDN10949.1 predicted protein [Histoplasma mississippiense (nom. inval.)]QSS63902.1 BRCA1 C Terminus domain-containing protein [Histoplasma capsulatum]
MSRNKRHLPSSIRDILTTPSATALGTFDPWNSVSTGHQRAEHSRSSSPGWQEVLSRKLGKQFRDTTGRGGGCGGTDSEWDWVSSDQYDDIRRREERIGDIRNLMGGVKKRRLDVQGRPDTECTTERDKIHCAITKGNGTLVLGDPGSERQKNCPAVHRDQAQNTPDTAGSGRKVEPIKSCTPAASELETVFSSSVPKSIQTKLHMTPQPEFPGSTSKGIFANLTIYVNGSTYPLISDHKLKHLLVSNGANVTFALARRTATHVILGRPNNNRNESGAGGGLAATKLQREIQRVGGKGLKFVGVEWVLESVKAGCRLPEARFAALHMAPDKQRSVLSMFQREL